VHKICYVIVGVKVVGLVVIAVDHFRLVLFRRLLYLQGGLSLDRLLVLLRSIVVIVTSQGGDYHSGKTLSC